MVDRMTGGELQTVREYLGLTGDALAGILGVNPRTLRAWEAGRDPIPERVREEVERIEADTAAAVGELVAALGDMRDPAVAVYRTDADLHAARPDMAHLTARWWRHVVARACHEVPGVVIGDAPSAPQTRDMIGLGVRTYHYRIYAPDGTHLYSGATTSMARRLREHRRVKRWMREPGLIVEVEEYPERWMALVAEARSGRGRHGWQVRGIGKAYLSKVPEPVRQRIAAGDIPDVEVLRLPVERALRELP